jgi:hypothetical protein
MTFINTTLPFLSAAVSLIFAGYIFRRWAYKRKGVHLLLWGTGMTFYAIGGFCEGYYGVWGWHPFIFRLWYLFGAILVAAWLGQGTVFFLAKRKWANATMIILGLASLWGVYKIFTAQLDPTMLNGSELSGHAIITSGVRGLTPFFNLYGVVTLVGGACYSAWIFFRKRILLHRVMGNVLIASGALAPAFGGLFSRVGIPAALYIGEFIGAILMFVGFLRATTPFQERQPQPVAQPL